MSLQGDWQKQTEEKRNKKQTADHFMQKQTEENDTCHLVEFENLGRSLTSEINS